MKQDKTSDQAQFLNEITLPLGFQNSFHLQVIPRTEFTLENLPEKMLEFKEDRDGVNELKCLSKTIKFTGNHLNLPPDTKKCSFSWLVQPKGEKEEREPVEVEVELNILDKITWELEVPLNLVELEMWNQGKLGFSIQPDFPHCPHLEISPDDGFDYDFSCQLEFTQIGEGEPKVGTEFQAQLEVHEVFQHCDWELLIQEITRDEKKQPSPLILTWNKEKEHSPKSWRVGCVTTLEEGSLPVIQRLTYPILQGNKELAYQYQLLIYSLDQENSANAEDSANAEEKELISVVQSWQPLSYGESSTRLKVPRPRLVDFSLDIQLNVGSDLQEFIQKIEDLKVLSANTEEHCQKNPKFYELYSESFQAEVEKHLEEIPNIWKKLYKPLQDLNKESSRELQALEEVIAIETFTDKGKENSVNQSLEELRSKVEGMQEEYASIQGWIEKETGNLWGNATSQEIWSKLKEKAGILIQHLEEIRSHVRMNECSLKISLENLAPEVFLPLVVTLQEVPPVMIGGRSFFVPFEKHRVYLQKELQHTWSFAASSTGNLYATDAVLFAKLSIPIEKREHKESWKLGYEGTWSFEEVLHFPEEEKKKGGREFFEVEHDLLYRIPSAKGTPEFLPDVNLEELNDRRFMFSA